MRFLSLLVCVASLQAADKPCLWMNAATAGGILEGPVDFTANKSACEFTRRNSDAKLRIEVGSQIAACAAPIERLHAIGNEAAACTIDATTQQVVGRVRKQTFLIRVTGAFPQQKLRQKAVSAAEQVAGNLF